MAGREGTGPSADETAETLRQLAVPAPAAPPDPDATAVAPRAGDLSGPLPRPGGRLSETVHTLARLPDAPLAALQSLAKYEILEELGRGGMGVVYRARDRSLGRHVAIKVVLPGGQGGEAEAQRFLREAQAAATLRHPGIVAVHEIGAAAGVPYLVMEYVEGRTVRGMLQELVALPARAALEIAVQVADAQPAACAGAGASMSRSTARRR